MGIEQNQSSVTKRRQFIKKAASNVGDVSYELSES